MKKTLILILALILLTTASACSDGGQQSSVGGGQSTVGGQSSVGGNQSVSAGDEPADEELWTQDIFFDFSCGSPEEYIIVEPYDYYGDVTAEEIIDEMSELSGLDFYATVSWEDGRYIVDWEPGSTLIAGLDDREQKDEFFFYDADSLRWFMMDSLWRTMSDFFGTEEIYYTMNGGADLELDGHYPIDFFPADIPYMGSAFYFAHVEQADIIQNPADMGDIELSEDEAMDLLSMLLDMPEGTALVAGGSEMVNGVPCWIFVFGKNTPEKFTAEEHFAVTGEGYIYIYDMYADEYVEYDVR